MKERLLELLTKLGYSATKLADEIGVQRSGISHILSGRNQPSMEFLVKLLKRFPDIDAEWLIMGNGSMTKIDDDKETLHHNSSKINEITKDLFSKPKGISTSEPVNKTLEKVTHVTGVTRIILLNSDGTFDVYHHSGNN